MVVPVSYIASLITRSRSGNVRCKQSTSSQQRNDVICPESFENAFQSVQSLVDSGSLDPNVLSHLRPVHISVSKPLPWVESNVSLASFDQNKLFSAHRNGNYRIFYRGFRSRSSPSVGLGADPGKFDNTYSSDSLKKLNLGALGKQSSQNELKELLSNSSPEEQTKVRVSKMFLLSQYLMNQFIGSIC